MRGIGVESNGIGRGCIEKRRREGVRGQVVSRKIIESPSLSTPVSGPDQPQPYSFFG